VADIRGTSPKVWNAWKAKLLEDLYHATLRVLGGGGLWVLRENRAHSAPEDRVLWDGRFIVPEGVAVRAPQGPADRALCRAALASAGNGEKPPPSAVFARMPMVDTVDGVCVPGASRYDPAAPVARFSPPQGATACAIWLAPVGASLIY